jgi:hypothetical protein
MRMRLTIAAQLHILRPVAPGMRTISASMNAAHLADQVLTGATALAGLILVFLGNVVSSYEGYAPQAKSSVRGRFRRRGWFAFAGFASSLVSALLALSYNWLDWDSLIITAIFLLAASLVCAFVAALLEVRDIK